MGGVTPSDYYDPGSQPNWRNFTPPATTPGVFTVANPTGGPPIPGRTTESSTRDGNGTQVAQAPPPTPDSVTAGSYTPEEVAGAKARGMIGPNGLPLFPPGSVRFNSQGVPYNPNRVGTPSSDPSNLALPGGVTPRPFNVGGPTPADVKPPEPAATPTPPLGAWTPDQISPWLRGHVTPIPPAAVPNRPPDSHIGTRPVWNPRPGEAGYNLGRQPAGNYTFPMMLGLALQAGFTGQAAYTAAAIGMAESNGNPNAIHYQDGGKPWNSYGLMQINGSNDRLVGGAQNALNPLASFKQAYILSHGGADFSAWSTFNDGSYKAYLDPNARPVDGAPVMGPRQEYIPPQPREPQHWGSEPERDWTPGRMPTAHDIPGILGALLPIAIAGVLGGGGLGMIAAYAGYQNARNKGQREAAKEQKTLFQDRLKETEAGLKEELLEASGLWARYGSDYTSPAAKQAWAALAAEYGDTQLRAALEAGNPAAIEQLFKKRDEAFQTIGKVSAAQTKADEQEKQREDDQKTMHDWGVPGVPSPSGGGAPSGPEKPWENAPSPQTGAPLPAPPPAGGPGAGAQPGGAPPAVPAAAPAPPSEQPPAPEEPQQPGPEAPAPAAPPGDTTLPDVRVAAPAPTPAAAPAAAPPPAAPKSVFDELVSEGINGQDIEKFKAGVPKEMLPILEGAIARKNAQIDAVRPGAAAAAQLAAIDSNFADYVNGVAHYTAQLPSPRANTGRDFSTRVQAAAKKINPAWNFANYKKQEEFAAPGSGNNTQARLTRAATMGEAAANVLRDAKALQDAGLDVSQDKISEAIDRVVKNMTGDPQYTAIANDILAFTQEDQALRTGNPSVTETEAQQTIVQGKILLGSLEQIRTYVTHNIDTANAAITHYQGQWDQMQGPGLMPGTDPDANAIIASMKYLDPRTGQYHGMPKDFVLPPVLRAGIPETAPPPTVPPTPTGAAPGAAPTWSTGSATGPKGEKIYTDGKGWFHADHTPVQ